VPFEFEFYTFPGDMTHLVVDAYMEVPPSTSPDLEKGNYTTLADRTEDRTEPISGVIGSL